MKILIVNTVPFSKNGITAVIMNYYRHFPAPSYTFDFISISPMDEDLMKTFESGKSRVFFLFRKEHPASYMIQLYGICRHGSYDAIHVHGNSATMGIELGIAHLCGIKKRIAHCHNSFCEHKVVHTFLYPIFRLQYTSALACSESAGTWLFGKNHYTILKNAVDVERYQYSQIIREHYRRLGNIEDDTFVIGHVGLFNRQKNQMFLLELLNQISDQDNTVLMLIGAGEEQEKIASRAKAMGLEQRIRFLGERGDVAEWMQTMDVFAFPSVYEGLPLVLVEAQASGLPCIISDSVSQETDLSGNNIFISLGDMETWKSAVLLNKPFTPDDRRSRSEHNIQKIRENGYDIKTEGRKLKELYDTLL